MLKLHEWCKNPFSTTLWIQGNWRDLKTQIQTIIRSDTYFHEFSTALLSVFSSGPCFFLCLFRAWHNVSHPSFFPSSLVFRLQSLYSSGSFLRSENENKGLCLKPRGRMEVRPIKDQSMCSQAPRKNRCLWSPPFCGQDGELLLAALDLCLLYLKGTFLWKRILYTTTLCKEREQVQAQGFG